MRTKAPDDEQFLEPLSVWDDGVAIEPAPAGRDVAATDARELVRECVGAVRAVLGESSQVRTQAPWQAVEAQPPQPRRSTWASTFSRMIGVHPAQLAGLPDWWRHAAPDGKVRVSRRLSLGEPQREPSGTWRTPGRLRSPWLWRSIPVELLLWPHLGSWTKLTLEPQRPVHVGRRYFKGGHRVLDALTTRLMRELVPTAR